MIAPALLLILALFQSPASPAAAPAPAIKAPTPDAVLPLLTRVPAFAAASGRKDLKLTQKTMALPGSEGKAYFVELQWTDGKGAAHSGVVVVAHKSLAGQVQKWLAEGDPWGVADIVEDKTWDELASDLKKARLAANEAVAVGDIRTIITSEYAFQSGASGSFGQIRCLSRPVECLPDYKGPVFLDAALTDAAEKNGYRRQFHPGPSTAMAKASPLLKTFAYIAVPLVPGESGQRSFCGDSTGRICALTDGSAPEVKAGECAASCPTLK
jgi:hypothetical protein